MTVTSHLTRRVTVNLVGAAVLWTPLNVNLAYWYDISDLGTLFQDTTALTPVTTDGQVVARVNDKSGNGLHLLQATASQRPIYRTAGGLHWLEFDGTNDLFDIGTLSNFITLTAFEYCIGARFITVSTNAANMNNDAVFSDSLANVGFAYGRTSNAIGLATNDGSADLAESTLTVGSDFVSQGRRESGINYHSVNGGTESSVVAGNPLGLTGTGQIGRGYDFSFCANFRWYGKFGAKSVFPVADRVAALTWMKAKSGVA